MTHRAKFKLIGAGSVLAVTLGLAMVAQQNRETGRHGTDDRVVFGEVTRTPETRSAAEPETRASQEAPEPVAQQSPAPTEPARPSPVEPGGARETERARRTSSESIPEGVNALLDRWQTSILDRDLDKQVACYAPKLDRFFNHRNVSLAEVRRDKQRMFDRYPKFEKYRLSDIVVEDMGERTATVSFRKEWDARGRSRFAGAERQRLKLSKFGNDWKIVSEEELKVYWVKRA